LFLLLLLLLQQLLLLLLLGQVRGSSSITGKTSRRWRQQCM
jgi:hypothetical protein